MYLLRILENGKEGRMRFEDMGISSYFPHMAKMGRNSHRQTASCGVYWMVEVLSSTVHGSG